MALRQLRSSLPRDVGLDRASLVHSDRGWITAISVIRHVKHELPQVTECRMLLHELVAKRHDANITQPSFIRISIGYWCVAESTTRLPSSVIKPSNCNNLRILLVYCRHTDSRVFEVIYVIPILSTQSSSTNTLMLRTHRLEQSSFICTHTPLTLSLFLGLSSRLTCSQDICSRSTVRTSDTLKPVFRAL